MLAVFNLIPNLLFGRGMILNPTFYVDFWQTYFLVAEAVSIAKPAVLVL